LVRFTLIFTAAAFVAAGLPSAASAQSGARRILFEEFSTAQCGFCPDGDLIAADIARRNPSVIWVTHHAGFGVDSMTAQGSNTIANAFVNFAPSGVIDRVLYPEHAAPYKNLGTARAKWDSIVTAHLGDELFAEIDITTFYYSEIPTLQCRVDVRFTSLPPPGDFRLHLFIIEDSIIGAGPGYDQKNYFNTTQGHPLKGAGDPIIGYAHHRVVSAIPSGAWGVAGVIPPTPEIGRTYSWEWDGSVFPVWDPSNMYRPDLITLVAFVAYDNPDPFKRRVVHAGEAKITAIIDDAKTAAAAPDGIILTAYPNPARDKVLLTAAPLNAGRSALIVTDPAGRKVAEAELSAGNPHFILPVSDLAEGMYFCRIITGSGVAAGKFLVLH